MQLKFRPSRYFAHEYKDPDAIALTGHELDGRAITLACVFKRDGKYVGISYVADSVETFPTKEQAKSYVVALCAVASNRLQFITNHK